MAISFDKGLGVHQYTLGIRAQRAEVLSSNIANADTPHYKARDVDFLSAIESARMHQTNRVKQDIFSMMDEKFSMQSPEFANQHVKYRVPNQPDTGDGNTVDIQQEQSSFMQNSLEYQMSLEFLGSKFSGMKKALRGD